MSITCAACRAGAADKPTSQAPAYSLTAWVLTTSQWQRSQCQKTCFTSSHVTAGCVAAFSFRRACLSL